jgi:hypothetical protein
MAVNATVRNIGNYVDENVSPLTDPVAIAAAIRDDNVTPLESGLVIADLCLYLGEHFKVLDESAPEAGQASDGMKAGIARPWSHRGKYSICKFCSSVTTS